MKINFQVAQSSPDLTKWHPKAPGMTPPDTFAVTKEVVSFDNSYGRKLKYDEKIAAIENKKGDEKDDTVAYCVCTVKKTKIFTRTFPYISKINPLPWRGI